VVVCLTQDTMWSCQAGSLGSVGQVVHGGDECVVDCTSQGNLGYGGGAITSWCIVACSLVGVLSVRGIASDIRVRVGRGIVGVITWIGTAVGRRRNTVRRRGRVECTVVHGAAGSRGIRVTTRVGSVTIVCVLRKLLRKLLLTVAPRRHVVGALSRVGWKLMSERIIAIVIVGLVLTVALTLTLTLTLVQTLLGVVTVASFAMLALYF
jgi:hypothetical protein